MQLIVLNAFQIVPKQLQQNTHGRFSRFLDCANGTKSRKASHSYCFFPAIETHGRHTIRFNLVATTQFYSV